MRWHAVVKAMKEVKPSKGRPQYVTGYCITSDHEKCPHGQPPVVWGNRILLTVHCYCWCHTEKEENEPIVSRQTEAETNSR